MLQLAPGKETRRLAVTETIKEVLRHAHFGSDKAPALQSLRGQAGYDFPDSEVVDENIVKAARMRIEVESLTRSSARKRSGWRRNVQTLKEASGIHDTEESPGIELSSPLSRYALALVSGQEGTADSIRKAEKLDDLHAREVRNMLKLRTRHGSLYWQHLGENIGEDGRLLVKQAQNRIMGDHDYYSQFPRDLNLQRRVSTAAVTAVLEAFRATPKI